MSYSFPTKKYPIAADVDNVATFLGQRQSDSATANGGIVASGGSPPVALLGVDATGISLAYLKAMADAIMSTLGLVAETTLSGFGVANTASTSFVDIGNGISSGFTKWTVTAPVTKSYLLEVDVETYMRVAPGSVYFRVTVDNAAPGGQPPDDAMRLTIYAVGQRQWKHFALVLPLVAGARDIRLQWRISGAGEVAEVDPVSKCRLILRGV